MSEGLKQKILSVLDARIDTVNKKYAFKMGMSTEEEELRKIRKKMLVLLDEAAKQIREKASDVLVCHKPTNATVRLPEVYIKLEEVLAVLEGEKK